MVKKGKSSTVDNVFIMIALIVLNVMFVIHFLLGVIGVIIGSIAGAFGMIIGGLGGVFSGLLYSIIANSWMAQYVSFGGIHPIAVVLLSISVFCLGGLWMIGNYFIIKYFIIVMKWYVNLNVRAFKKYEP